MCVTTTIVFNGITYYVTEDGFGYFVSVEGSACVPATVVYTDGIVSSLKCVIGNVSVTIPWTPNTCE